VRLPGRLRRTALVLVALGAVATAAACTGDGAPPRGAAPSTSDPAGSYLALGDSVPFGYRGGPTGADYSKAATFTGYPELLGKELGLTVVNASCPGETTASFTDATAQSNGCENAPRAAAGYRTFYPLHVLYDSVQQSQLDFAVRTLQRRKDVSLVTLQLGANDAFLCQATTSDACAAEVGGVAQTVQTALGSILAALRDRGGYRGRIVVVTYYAMDYAGTAAGPTQLLDGAMAAAAQAHGATVASGFDAFRAAAQAAGGDSTAAGLVIPSDVHPTATGQQLLADAVQKALPR
jgi:lysophospholipase L1-like esterase